MRCRFGSRGNIKIFVFDHGVQPQRQRDMKVSAQRVLFQRLFDDFTEIPVHHMVVHKRPFQSVPQRVFEIKIAPEIGDGHSHRGDEDVEYGEVVRGPLEGMDYVRFQQRWTEVFERRLGGEDKQFRERLEQKRIDRG